MANINIELTEADVRRLVRSELERIMGDISLSDKDVQVEVKSKQNYKAEWEPAAFRARVVKDIGNL